MEAGDEIGQKAVVDNLKAPRGKVVVEKKPTNQRDGLSKFTKTVTVVISIIVLADVAFMFIKPVLREEGRSLAVAVPLPNAEHQPAPERYASHGGQQPTAAQPSSTTISQPAAPTQLDIGSAQDDSRIEALAVKKLSEDIELGGVVTTVRKARVVLSGVVRSAEAKSEAGRLVATVQGVRSVDNKITVTD